jgi:aminoglycoside phosphotransferase family enzyme
MKAEDAADMMDQERAADRFKQRSAVAIAFFAMLLAITGLGGQNATKDALNSNIMASNDWNFFQAKNMRQTAYALAAAEMESAWLAVPNLPAEARAALESRADAYRKTVARYESEPIPTRARRNWLRAPRNTRRNATAR